MSPSDPYEEFEIELSTPTSEFLASLEVQTVDELLDLPVIRAPRQVAGELRQLLAELDFSGAVVTTILNDKGRPNTT